MNTCACESENREFYLILVEGCTVEGGEDTYLNNYTTGIINLRMPRLGWQYTCYYALHVLLMVRAEFKNILGPHVLLFVTELSGPCTPQIDNYTNLQTSSHQPRGGL